MTLMSWADLSYILPITAVGYVLSAVAGKVFLDEQYAADSRRNRPGRTYASGDTLSVRWLLVAAIVGSTTAGDLLQSFEMKQHKQSTIAQTVGFLHRPLLLLSILCMAVSFFAFLALLKIADLSFAVPATAATVVVETLLARVVLKERVDGRRWAGAVLVAVGVALLAV
jgi:drug/metabolite transporter (DMT)-like permease